MVGMIGTRLRLARLRLAGLRLARGVRMARKVKLEA